MERQTGRGNVWGTLRCLSMVMGLVISFGCAVNPVSGRPELVLTTKEGEKELGAEVAREVEESMGLVKDPLLNGYVHAVGQKLAKHSPRQDVTYHFNIVEMEEPNAFALPGGFVYVSRGLLALTNSEDELAGVVGHEIGHVAARHAVQRQSAAAAAVPFAIVGGITGAVTGIVSERLGDAIIGATGTAIGAAFAPYSRSQERESDEVGVQLLADAGYDPVALSTFLHTLEREVELKLGEKREASFFDTHPATPERVANTAEQAESVKRSPGQPVVPNQRAFFKKLDGLVVGQNPAEGVVRENLFLHPDLRFALEFPSGWKVQNTRQLVAGIEPSEQAFMALQVAGEGDDPMAVPRELERKMKEKDSDANLVDRVERFKIGNLRAARTVLQTRTKSGPTSIDLTWIAYNGLLYQILAISETENYERYRPAITGSVKTFRPITAAERSGVKVAKLRIATAREGETLAQLVARKGSAWTPEEAAVANARQPESRLKGGEPIKLAVEEPYRP